jgi:hypothetical protein
MPSMAGDRLPYDADVDAYVEIDLASARLARELRDSARQIVGLLPAPAGAPVQRVARQLAVASSRLTRTAVVILDPEATTAWHDEAADDDLASHALFALRRVDPLIVVCAPDHAAPPGAKAELLKLMLRHVEANVSYGLTLVDMSGLARPGEMLGAQSLVEGIIVVGEVARTTEDDLVRAARLVPEELGLGVLLGE